MSGTFDNDQVFGLSLLSNGQTSSWSKNDIQSLINTYLGSQWNVVWGPLVIADTVNQQTLENCVYVAQNVASPSNYVVAIAGTQFTSVIDKLLEDGNVELEQFPNENWITVTGGTVTGVKILLENTDKDSGLTLTEYLASLVNTGNSINLMVTGHSLGGALSTAMAYVLQTAQTQTGTFTKTDGSGSFSFGSWDPHQRASLQLLATASPAVGGTDFQSQIQDAFGAASVVWNQYDLVPHAWWKVGANMRDLYSSVDIEPGLCIGGIIDTLSALVNPDDYVQVNPNYTFSGDIDLIIPQFNCASSEGFPYTFEVMTQHIVAYGIYFHRMDILNALNGAEIGPIACRAFNSFCPDAKCDCGVL